MKNNPRAHLLPAWRLGKLYDSTAAVQVKRLQVLKPQAAVDAIRDFMRYEFDEVCVALLLDSGRKMMGIVRVIEGSIDHIDIEARKVFQTVLAEHAAAGFILAHNHPGGDPAPSQRDLDFMKEIAGLGMRLNCPLKDFIVLGDNGAFWSAKNETFEI